MPVTELLLLRHGHRLAWTLDSATGIYTSSHAFPTRLPADPPLASHGVRQAKETGVYLCDVLKTKAREGTLRIYSSLFYRCLETLRPCVEALRADVEEGSGLLVRGERGLGEWFGKAWFQQPGAGGVEMLRDRFYPWLDPGYESLVVPDQHGERIEELHARVARALEAIVRDVDREFEEAGRGEEEITLLLSTHAATIIASGRALTGRMPEDLDEEDFSCFTCGISRFKRRTGHEKADWERRLGVAGGWDCITNSDCSHLSEGEERGWHFHGDESFDSYGASGPAISDGGSLDNGRRIERIEDSNERPGNTAKL